MAIFGTLRMKTFAAVMFVNFLAIALIAVFFQQRATSFFEEAYADSLYDGVHIGGKALDGGFQTVYRIALEASFDARIKELAEQGDPAALQELSLLLQQYKAQSPLVDAVYCYLPAHGILVKANGYRPVALLPSEERTVWAETIARQTGLRPLAAEDVLGAARKKVFLYHAAVHSGDAVIADLTYTVSERGLYYAYLAMSCCSMGLGASCRAAVCPMRQRRQRSGRSCRMLRQDGGAHELAVSAVPSRGRSFPSPA